MRTHCPQCEEPLEDDGDRIYDDSCPSCGWRTYDREVSDKLNNAIMAHHKAVASLAEEIFNHQVKVDIKSEIPTFNTGWEALDKTSREDFFARARQVLRSRTEYWRGFLIAVRESQRKPLKESSHGI